MSLVKLAFIYNPEKHITVSFITDKATWNDGLGKIICAIKYLANVGSSRELEILDFYDRKGTDADRKLRVGVDGDGHFSIAKLKINNKEVPFSKMVKDDMHGEVNFEYYKVK